MRTIDRVSNPPRPSVLVSKRDDPTAARAEAAHAGQKLRGIDFDLEALSPRSWRAAIWCGQRTRVNG
jgi:hypothetical protein